MSSESPTRGARNRNRLRRVALTLLVGVGMATAGCIPTLSQPRGEQHLEAMRQASSHRHHGRAQEAAASWGEAAESAERRVDRDEAQYRQAMTLIRLGETARGRAILEEVAARRPISRRTVRARYVVANLQIEDGEVAAGEAELISIIEDHPDAGPASRALWTLMDRRSDTPISDRLSLLRRLYEQVGQQDVGDDLLSFEASLLHEQEQPEAAVATLERLVLEHAYPEGQRWDDAFVQLADWAVEAEQPERAIEYLERMLSVHTDSIVPGSQTLPLFPISRLRVARIYRDELHNSDAAETHFRAAYTDFPTSRYRDDALAELGEMFLQDGRQEDGCEMLRRVVSEFEVGGARRRAQARVEADCRQDQ